MRIKRREAEVCSSEEIKEPVEDTQLDPESDYIEGEAEDIECSQYVEACQYIRQAIDSLGNVAANNQMAKDAIANLSVIYFELK